MLDDTDLLGSGKIEKEIESLKQKLKSQEEVKLLAEQVIHDIHSPLLALSVFIRSCKSLSEKDKAFLESAVDSIEDITRNLITKYEESGGIDKSISGVMEYVFVSFSLPDIIQTKKYQIRKPNIKINFLNDIIDDFVFIKGNNTSFRRLISYLINSAVESLDISGGTVDVGFSVENQEVKIYVQDNGNAIPNGIVNAIINGDVSCNQDKENGCYSNIWQAKKLIGKIGGKILLQSKEGVGTKITIVFEQVDSPEWIAKEVVIPRQSIVVILDDDRSTYKLLENRLYDHFNDISVQYFQVGHDAVDFINTSEEKEKIFLLVDYDLRNQNMNGIDIIEKCKLQRQSILVSSGHVHKIRNFFEKSRVIKFLSKAHIPNISFKIT